MFSCFFSLFSTDFSSIFYTLLLAGHNFECSGKISDPEECYIKAVIILMLTAATLTKKYRSFFLLSLKSVAHSVSFLKLKELCDLHTDCLYYQ